MIKNAIILAAGKSTRFAPFTYEKPKGLFIVRGEVLIERQINQLIDRSKGYLSCIGIYEGEILLFGAEI